MDAFLRAVMRRRNLEQGIGDGVAADELERAKVLDAADEERARWLEEHNAKARCRECRRGVNERASGFIPDRCVRCEKEGRRKRPRKVAEELPAASPVPTHTRDDRTEEPPPLETVSPPADVVEATAEVPRVCLPRKRWKEGNRRPTVLERTLQRFADGFARGVSGEPTPRRGKR